MDIVINNAVEIKNAELKKVTSEIKKASANVIGNTYKIAYLIAKVEDGELYAEDGFEDTFDYVKKCFGLEKASAYNLIKVGREFITELEDEKGNIKGFETLLTHGKKDFSISQIFKMLPLGIDKAKELTADGVINEEMSCRQIEKIVKDNTEGTKARGKSKTEPEPEETTEPEDDSEILMIEWDDVPEELQNLLLSTYEDNLEGVTSIQINL